MKIKSFASLVPSVVIASVIVWITGCISVGPDYENPEIETPDTWNQIVMGDFESETPDLQSWWKVFGDETLNALIDKVALSNVDLKTAAARIEQARALRGVAAGGYYPTIEGIGTASKIKTSEDLTPAGADRDGELYQAGLSMGWELDLWGRVRRLVESADASLQATEESYRDLMVLLLSETAANYIKVRTIQARIAFAESNLTAQSKTLGLTKNRYDAGLVPSLDVAQAELNYSRTAATIPLLHQSLVAAMNRLSVLVGEMPGALRDVLGDGSGIPAASAKLNIGLPADLLRQRPDLRQAERELAAQNARIGVAKADFYPTLTLPGTLVLEGNGSGSASTAYSFGPQLRWNLFAGGRIRNAVRAEEAATKAALHIYEQSLLLALEETEDAMAAFAYEQDRVQSLGKAASAAQESVARVNELYISGLTDFQNVLAMERDLLQQQDQLAESQGLISLYLVQLYKALGGGWEATAAGELNEEKR